MALKKDERRPCQWVVYKSYVCAQFVPQQNLNSIKISTIALCCDHRPLNKHDATQWVPIDRKLCLTSHVSDVCSFSKSNLWHSPAECQRMSIVLSPKVHFWVFSRSCHNYLSFADAIKRICCCFSIATAVNYSFCRLHLPSLDKIAKSVRFLNSIVDHFALRFT